MTFSKDPNRLYPSQPDEIYVQGRYNLGIKFYGILLKYPGETVTVVAAPYGLGFVGYPAIYASAIRGAEGGERSAD